MRQKRVWRDTNFRRSRKTWLLLLLLLVSAFPFPVQAQKKKMIENLLSAHPEMFGKILENPEKYRVQILYTQIDRDAKNRPSFTSYRYRVNPQEYFYPASTVKLPGALVALEKLNQLHVEGLDKHTPLKIGKAYAGQTEVSTDSTAHNHLPSLAHYIRKVLVVSDNDAYNRLYEFLGQQYLNEALHQKGYTDVRLVHRLSIFLSPDENRHTNPFTFYLGNNSVYRQPLVQNPNPIPNHLKETHLGKGYLQGGKLVQEPMDFSEKNAISVETLQSILKSVMFPDFVPEKQRFNLTPDDYIFLYKYLSTLPRESAFPSYDPEEYPDSYVKFLLYGNRKERIPEHIRIFNDGKYEYDEEGFPFMRDLGQVVYQHELQRKRRYPPNLNRFRMSYKGM
ncbi:hypothetical protein BH24BAC1_BH24BAC1_27900 [soil metagenome]